MDVSALVSAGASTLVNLMVTDGWKAAEDRFAALLGRGEKDPGKAAEELRTSRATLEEARRHGDARAAADLEAYWRVRLHGLMREDGDAAGLLARLLAELEGSAGPADGRHEINGNTFRGQAQIQQGGHHNTQTRR
ncbi:hypothetical protein [Actinospica robiniae]|uniref:hypothetical protein n=1 Tax=Actinospica robiniae TaxID=304901 RepID=UPI0003F58019|nr:hypothetical protein [Actinospica robiniae]